MKIARLLALLALPLALAACSSDSKTIDEVLVSGDGVWRVDRYVTELPDGTIRDATVNFNGYRYTFQEGGVVVSRGRTGTRRGVWGNAKLDGRATFGIVIEGTPMYFGPNFVWFVDELEDTLVSLSVGDPAAGRTRLVFVKL